MEQTTQVIQIAIILGSQSDFKYGKMTQTILKKEYNLDSTLDIISAHRDPEKASRFAQEASERGLRVIICMAGMAAHLAGFMASRTSLPVIGVPLEGGVLNGLDALLSTVQMPRGVPVACMTIGMHGAINSAHMAARILGVKCFTK